MRRKPLSIAFRVTEEQHKMINEKAKNSNLSKTDFIVKCCFDKEIIIVNDVQELMKELLSVGNNDESGGRRFKTNLYEIG